MSEDVAIPTRSKGYVTQPAAAASWWNDLSQEHVPDLLFPLSIDTYRRMRKDPQVASILRAVKSPLLRVQWRIDPAGARSEVVDLVAKDLGLPVVGQPDRPPTRRQGRFSWREHVRLALTSQDFGAAYFEQEALFDPADGYSHLHRLGFRPMWTLTEPPEVASDGGLVSIKQYGLIGKDTDRVIPVKQLVAYVRDREGGNWLGESVLRPAYQPYLLRDRLVRIDTIKNDRYGVGTPYYRAGTDKQEEIDRGTELMQQMRSGEEAGFAGPKDSDVKIVTPTGTSPNVLASIEYHDRKIAGTVLGHWMNLGQQSGTGSYALGRVQVDEFAESLESINDDLEEIANAHIVEDLVDWNWGRDEPAPRLVADSISEKWTATMLRDLATAGFLFPDRSTEEWLRQTVGAPPKDNFSQPQPQQGAA